ncbi:hypothetical protein [Streptomyces sp. S1D4-20]|uniref:hypothetical protein n=1 Tax=Streptomyces sp. S1D4-20 TaxID=2594462 RepID=UPI001162DDF6|nr:hypothetical protein [Streptomyces sp. S1D4-20]QDN54042.1 hypothetical protein FNV67_00230 [Streptomyces sp. S1D4-20]
MPEPSPTPPAARTARLIVQAAALRSALDTREQRTATDRSEHDRGLHTFARRLLAEPFSESVAAELACCGRTLPPDVAAALRTEPDA